MRKAVVFLILFVCGAVTGTLLSMKKISKAAKYATELAEEILGKRTAKAGDQFRWPNAEVQYRIDSKYTKEIESAIDHVEANTCIRFKKVTANFQGPHVVFKALNGCSARTGYFAGSGSSDVSIVDSCKTMGKITHEIGHVIGFLHEQGRPDRDDYVTVFNNNIRPNKRDQFVKYSGVDTYNLPYDLDSVMQYGPAYLSENEDNTILPNNVEDYFRIGQRKGLSFQDVKLANLMYNCKEKCRRDKVCAQSTCSGCVCPPGKTGANCDQNDPNDPRVKCIYKISQAQSINWTWTRTGYQQCMWIITAPPGSVINAKFSKFLLQKKYKASGKSDMRFTGKCMWGHLELRTTDSKFLGDKYCASDLLNKEKTSTGNRMIMIMDNPDSYRQDGFTADVTFVSNRG